MTPLFHWGVFCIILHAACAKIKFKSKEEQPHIEKEGIDAVLKWSKERVQEAERSFASTGYSRYASPETWDNEVFYMLMVDRFANGDLNNDYVNIPNPQITQLESEEPYSVGNWRHGGDLEGLRSRLGYLEELGITAIWISPILLNNGGSPWGYYLSDPSMIDPGFGSKELLREVVHEAHARGIRVILDIVTNQAVSTDFQYAGSTPSIDKVTACASSASNSYWNESRSGKPNSSLVANRSKLAFGGQLPYYMRTQSFYQGCGSQRDYRPMGKPFEDLPVAFNDSKAIYYSGGLVWPDIFSTPSIAPDFDTTDAGWQELFTNLMKYWVAYADLDGFRLDAAKYTTADFVAYFSTNVRVYAKTIGKNNYYLTGEMLAPGMIPFMYLYLGRGPPREKQEPSCLAHAGCSGLIGDCCPTPDGHRLECCFADIQESKPMPKKVQDLFEQLDEVAKTLSPPGPGLPTYYPTDANYYQRQLAKGANNGTDWWDRADWQLSMENNLKLFTEMGAKAEWTFQVVDTQDLTRTLMKDELGNQPWRLIPAMAWLFTWWGLPSVYYGMEQALNGMCVKYGEDGKKETIIAEWIRDDPRDAVERACADENDDARKRQDFFTGGPWMLGSGVPEVQKYAAISGMMMDASAPSWCEEPLLNREHSLWRYTRSLTRIRRSCPLLNTVPATKVFGGNEGIMAYWKYPKNPKDKGPPCVLVVLDYNEQPMGSQSFSLPPTDKATLKNAQKFVDLLDPSRTAVVTEVTSTDLTAGRMLAAGDFILKADADNKPAHSAIFIPVEYAKMDGPNADWMVCDGTGIELPPHPHAQECFAPPMWMALVGMVISIGIVVGVLVWNRKYSGVFLCICKEPSPVDVLDCPDVDGNEKPQHIFIATLEHTVPERKVKVSAGGLGKVLDQMLREHPPGRLSLVHPKFAGVDYGELTPFTSLSVTVDMSKENIQVYTFDSTQKNIQRHWFFLEHKWFESLISLDAPYPYPQTKLSVLRFWSLWNQACAQLMGMLKPDIYHCMDYHAAMVPLYLPPSERVATIIVLHNADYDGAIETDFISDVFWQAVPPLRRLSLIFNLDTEAIRKYLTFEGRFNMLWSGISCLEEYQSGHGICTVSGKYAAELKRERTMFKGLPAVLPLDNAIDSAADDGPKTIDELKRARASAKTQLQEFCGLTPNPNAKILIFVGRWVKQKGVDHIALLASNILDNNLDVQFVLAGPPGDPYGSYAQELLSPLAEQYPGRLFVVTRFFIIPKEARSGAHFCLMPSCSEPFGYVDVEFGLLGVPSLGCAIGGLGKMPGIYFRQQNSDSQEMLLAGFSVAVDYALGMRDQDYWAMALACIPAQFPFSIWRENLMAIYRTAQVNFDGERVCCGEDLLTLDNETGFNVLMEHPATNKEGYGKVRDIRVVKGKKNATVRVQHQLQRMQVTEATEFLQQPVSEGRVKELMSFWMATEGRGTDAETLQSHISLGDQRMNERNFATRELMRPCKGFQRLLGTCLKIHFFIALGYIISPFIDARLDIMTRRAQGAFDYKMSITSGIVARLGCVAGCGIWLALSRQIPANLLMAIALFGNERMYSLSHGLESSTAFALLAFQFAAGIFTTSRWLFLIWNFNEDFHGGFQVGARRIALIETSRQVVAGTLKCIHGHVSPSVISGLFSFTILLLIILILLAPSCYSSYVLPATKFWNEIRNHKVYVLLTISMALNGLAVFAWDCQDKWLSINGWRSNEIDFIRMIQTIVLVGPIFLVFWALRFMSVWGPWAMRDLTCLLPPGSLLLSLAFWELGTLHYRSYIFVAAMTVAMVIDIMRYAAFWTSMLTTLANKWYALIGSFAAFAFIKFCEALSPFVVHFITWPWNISAVFSRTIPDAPEAHLPKLQAGTFFSVWPLALLAYAAQLAARKYYVGEVLTYKGHGNLMPDGTVGWNNSDMAFVSSNDVVVNHEIPAIETDDDDDDSGSDSSEEEVFTRY